jgi:gluconolactonase
MAQPNDIAIAPKSGRVYASGQKYNADTVVGDGDLWLCDGGGKDLAAVTSSPYLPVKAIRLGVFGRTNGIEVSPDEKTLYLSEAFNKNFNVISNKIWKFGIDPRSGYVWNQTLFCDFGQLDGSEAVDVDGIRTDKDGNLFVTRNGGGEVIKFSPNGEVLLRIQLPSTKNPTNLELGGTNGTSLFVLGECTAATDKGCVDVWHGNSVSGRAFHDLNSA